RNSSTKDRKTQGARRGWVQPRRGRVDIPKMQSTATAVMLRARAPVGQDLALRRLDSDEALPLQAFEHRKRRRQWFAALAVVPASVRDRYLDEGDQEFGRRPLITRLHRDGGEATGDRASAALARAPAPSSLPSGRRAP